MQRPYYEQLRPPSALVDTIECFWRLLLPMVADPSEIISAEGRAQILFQFEGQSQVIVSPSEGPFDCASSWLMRPIAQAVRVRQAGVSNSAMIGVRFSPGGWAAFRHSDTTDKQLYSVMPLRDFYRPSEVRLLEEQLYHALRTPQWAYPLIKFFLHRKVEQSHHDRIMYAAQRLQQRQLSVPALAYEVNLSERQFGRVFRKLVGLPPIQYARVARLYRVLTLPHQHLYGVTLEHVAARHGYHDASHLIRDFQELAGMSPSEYFSGYHDLLEQKFREHDGFLQWEPDMMGVLFNE